MFENATIICTSYTKWYRKSASGVQGKDVVQFLRDACNRRKDIDIDIEALLNDTVGTLMACAFKENTCQIGVILGTGTNACYMEKLSNCPKFKKFKFHDDKYPKEMIINMEWGAFGDDGCLDFIRTIYDSQVDERTINPGFHIFEKMISGMYMGELKTMQILEDIGVENITIQDCEIVAYVCSVISTRAAHLTAAGITCLLNRLQKPYVTVGIDGSLFRFHPHFARIMDQKIDQLLPKNLEYQLMLSEDGSGRGAALVAAVARRIKREAREMSKIN
uniref:Phosphotransferase n=1 Tax=Brugia malayi TaxID=6279 RepID=A0A5S6PKC2_BRUMA